jgi:hypothetical protein
MSKSTSQSEKVWILHQHTFTGLSEASERLQQRDLPQFAWCLRGQLRQRQQLCCCLHCRIDAASVLVRTHLLRRGTELITLMGTMLYSAVCDKFLGWVLPLGIAGTPVVNQALLFAGRHLGPDSALLLDELQLHSYSLAHEVRRKCRIVFITSTVKGQELAAATCCHSPTPSLPSKHHRMVLGQQQRLDQHLLIRRVVMVFLLLCCAAGGCLHAAATVTARHCLPLRTAGNSQAAHVPRSCGSQQHPGKHTGKYHSGCRFIGWAQRALPIAVDTRPVRNRGYTGPTKSRFDAVTNAHAARKLVNTLSHLSRVFELYPVHTYFLTIRAKSEDSFFLAFAAVLPRSHWMQRSPSLPSRELSFEPRVAFTHATFLFFSPMTTCAPDKNTLSIAVNF